jgi:hypothetical protein
MSNNSTLLDFKTFIISEADADSIRSFFDSHNLIMFFKFEDKYYAAGEDDRMVFATMMDINSRHRLEPDVVFTAVDVEKALNDRSSDPVVNNSVGFNKPKADKIKIIEEEEVVKKLKNKITDEPVAGSKEKENILINDQ